MGFKLVLALMWTTTNIQGGSDMIISYIQRPRIKMEGWGRDQFDGFNNMLLCIILKSGVQRKQLLLQKITETNEQQLLATTSWK